MQKKHFPDADRHEAFKASLEKRHLMPLLTNDLSEIVEEYSVFFSVFSALFILQFDLITGEEIEFPVLFTLPVAIAAFGLNRYLAYCFSIALPLLRVGFVLFLWERDQAFHVLAINAAITISALITYSYLVTKISLKKKRLEERIKSLEGSRKNH